MTSPSSHEGRSTPSVAQATQVEANGCVTSWQSSRETVPTELSDEELERHIVSCGYLMEQAMQRWHDSGDFGDRGEADRWKILMHEAIKARRPEYVAKLELERGLR